MLRSVSRVLALALTVGALGSVAARATTHGAVQEPTAVSALSSSDWWLLAQSSSCLTATCNETLLATIDAGRSFTPTGPLPVADPSAVYAADDHDLFLSSSNGRIWLSHDAGRSWRAVNPSGSQGRPLFLEMPEVGDGYAYAVGWRGDTTELLRASIASLAVDPDPATAWQRLRAAPPGAVMGLMVRGSEVLVLSQPSGSSAFPRIHISEDDGQTFQATGAELPVIGCGFYPRGDATWADCATGMLFGIWRSTDGDHRFTPAGSDAYRKTTPTRPVFAGTSGAGFAALSASTALLGLDPLYRTTDGGASYHRLAWRPTGITEWMQFGVVRPGYALALGRFTAAGGTGARPRFDYRLYAVTALGTRFHRIRIRVR